MSPDQMTHLERMIREGFDAQVQSYAAGLMKTYLAPNQAAARANGRLRDGIRKLAAHYGNACDVLRTEFEPDERPADQPRPEE